MTIEAQLFCCEGPDARRRSTSWEREPYAHPQGVGPSFFLRFSELGLLPWSEIRHVAAWLLERG